MLKGFLLFSTFGNLLWVFYMATTEGFTPFAIWVLIYFAITLAFIFSAETEEKSYFGLIFERRKLEEQAKIDKLKADAK